MQSREHRGQTYRLRTAGPQGRVSLFYVQFDDVAAFSDHEPAIQRVIDLQIALGTATAPNALPPSTPPASVPATAPTPSSGAAPNRTSDHERTLWDDPQFQKARAQISAASIVSIYLNAHRSPFPSRHAAHVASSEWQWLVQLWSSCDSLMLGARLADGIVVDVSLQYDKRTTAPVWQTLVAHGQGDNAFLKRVPADAVCAMTGRVSPQLLGAWLDARSRDDRRWDSVRQVLRGLLQGADPYTDILPRLGLNGGLYVEPARTAAPDDSPWSAVFAWELPAGTPAANAAAPATGPAADSDGDPRAAHANRVELQPALQSVLQFGLQLWTAWHNSQQSVETAVLRRGEQAGVPIVWIDRLGGFQPAFAVTDQWLVLSTSPASLRAFIAGPPDGGLPTAPDYQRWSQACFPGENQVLFVHLAHLRKLLADRRDGFLQQLGQLRSDVSPEQIEQRFAHIEELITLLDGAFVAASLQPDCVRVVIGGVTAPAAAPAK